MKQALPSSLSPAALIKRRVAAGTMLSKFKYIPPSVQVDHLVIGAGVIGLAIGERLLKAFDSKSSFLVERNGQFGQETSSRNSEVIHSGLYYPTNSLKTSLCIRGRELLYQRCAKHSIPHRKTGKLILALNAEQEKYCVGLREKALEIEKLGLGKVPLEWLSGDEVRRREPDVSKEVVGALNSPETGIVSSHELMEHLEGEIEESEMGELVYGTKVVRIDNAKDYGGKDGWVVQTLTDDGKDGELSSVGARVVINAAGLGAHHIANQILPSSSQIRQYFAKGSYFSYRGPGISSVRHLLYPCPDPHSLAGLGTHLTMNLDNEVRFGPDVEWLEEPENEDEKIDFWKNRLEVSEDRLDEAVEMVRKFLPHVEREGFQPDYVGIRPKLSPPNSPAVDFSITHPAPGFISLVGMESPGLTSSLAIGEYVEKMIREQVWGLPGKGRGKKVSEGGQEEDWA